MYIFVFRCCVQYSGAGDLWSAAYFSAIRSAIFISDEDILISFRLVVNATKR